MAASKCGPCEGDPQCIAFCGGTGQRGAPSALVCSRRLLRVISGHLHPGSVGRPDIALTGIHRVVGGRRDWKVAGVRVVAIAGILYLGYVCLLFHHSFMDRGTRDVSWRSTIAFPAL